MTNKEKNIIDVYILKGIASITEKDIPGINNIINYELIPYELLLKLYSYLVLEFSVMKNPLLKDSIFNDNIVLSPYLTMEKMYYIFGMFGIFSMFEPNIVKAEIPFYDDMINELDNIPILTNDINENIKLFINLNNTIQEFNSPTKNTLYVLTVAFKDIINNFEYFIDNLIINRKNNKIHLVDRVNIDLLKISEEKKREQDKLDKYEQDRLEIQKIIDNEMGYKNNGRDKLKHKKESLFKKASNFLNHKNK